MSIKIVIVDDHDVVRQGLRTLFSLERDLEVVGLAATGHEGIDLVRQLKPDVLLLDLWMPGMDGIEFLKLIRPEFPELYILILTSSFEAQTISRGIKAGANGYLLKNMDASTLIHSIKNRVTGAVQLSKDAALLMTSLVVKNNYQEAPPVIQNITIPTSSDRDLSFSMHLTGRETEILALLAEGKSNKEIARDLDLSIATVKTHVSIILGKLGLESRTQAALFATNKGLLEKTPE